MLGRWAAYLSNAAQWGHLTSEPCSIVALPPISSPRAGALEILAGRDAGALLRLWGGTTAQPCISLFPGRSRRSTRSTSAVACLRYLRVDAGWSDALADDAIRLEELSPKPHGGGRWGAGQAKTGETIRGDVAVFSHLLAERLLFQILDQAPCEGLTNVEESHVGVVRGVCRVANPTYNGLLRAPWFAQNDRWACSIGGQKRF